MLLTLNICGWFPTHSQFPAFSKWQHLEFTFSLSFPSFQIFGFIYLYAVLPIGGFGGVQKNWENSLVGCLVLARVHGLSCQEYSADGSHTEPPCPSQHGVSQSLFQDVADISSFLTLLFPPGPNDRDGYIQTHEVSWLSLVRLIFPLRFTLSPLNFDKQKDNFHFHTVNVCMKKKSFHMSSILVLKYKERLS